MAQFPVTNGQSSRTGRQPAGDLPPSVVQDSSPSAVHNGPRSGSSLAAPYLRDFVSANDFKLATDPDDTNCIQAAAQAAIAAGLRLYVPGKRTISSTLLFESATSGHPEFILDVDAGRAADQGSVAGSCEWAWAGGNSTSMIRTINLIKSTWTNVHLNWPDTASGIVGYDHDQDSGGSGITANITGNTFISCNVNVNTPATATGWRMGENAPGAGNITSQTWLNCNFNTQDLSLAGTAVGWRVMGANTLALFFYGCGAAGCQAGFTSEKDAGGVSDGNHSFYFYGMSNSHNQIDYQFRGLGSYAIVGGRSEVGLRFLDDQLGTLGNDNFTATILISGVEIAGYAPVDGIIFNRTCGGILTLQGCHINNTSQYGSAMVTLSCRSTAYGVAEIRDCSICATQPFYTVSSGNWTVYQSGNIQMDTSQRAAGLFSDSERTDIQTFTTNGTWTKPSFGTATFVRVIAGGGGGGSGRRGAAATVRCGGGGGGSGAISDGVFPTSLLGSTETVVCSVGQSGGAAVAVNDTNGNSGTNGGTSRFGSWLQASGGTGGAGGTNAAGGGGAGGLGLLGGNSGISASTTGAAATNGGAVGTAGGGGAAGGITSADVAGNGGNGSSSFAIQGQSGGSGGVVGGAAAGNGGGLSASSATPGCGGGGGAASITGAAGAGGNGGNYGAGGGGGGASLDGNNSGAGGNGAGGFVQVITR